MITLEQVQELDAKIKQAVSLISTLREENAQLRSTLSNYENKITDLETMVLSLEDGQTNIELGLIDAISKLDNLDIVEKLQTEETSEELSPSAETEIVDLENSHENDHSKQAENITEDFSQTEELKTEEFGEEELITEVETAVDEVSTDDITIESAIENSDEDNEITYDENPIDQETPTVESQEEIENISDEVQNEIDEPIIEESTEKKKGNDYSIPMLEIF